LPCWEFYVLNYYVGDTVYSRCDDVMVVLDKIRDLQSRVDKIHDLCVNLSGVD
jgi:hypothetical protein